MSLDSQDHVQPMPPRQSVARGQLPRGPSPEDLQLCKEMLADDERMLAEYEADIVPATDSAGQTPANPAWAEAAGWGQCPLGVRHPTALPLLLPAPISATYCTVPPLREWSEDKIDRLRQRIQCHGVLNILGRPAATGMERVLRVPPRRPPRAGVTPPPNPVRTGSRTSSTSTHYRKPTA
jgi:hypothetical protein